MSRISHQNQPVSTDFIIIGAGLSGLTTAYYLKKRHRITPLILEARSEIGGRIKTTDSIDLGATWLGKEHRNLLKLLDELGIETFPQYQKGKGIFIHSAAEPPHYFDTEENSSSTFRIAGGSSNLIDALRKASDINIKSNQRVVKINDENNVLEIISDKNTFHAKKVVITVPPQLAMQTMQFTPSLPTQLQEEMKSTHTWMSNAIKVALAFEKKFWRKKNLSGTLIAPNGPVIELYDHSNLQGNSYSLMGFANEALREHSPDNRKQVIIEFLTSYFGDQINDYTSYKEKDWLEDQFTATPFSKSIYMHPEYGSEVFEKSYMGDKLLFSGSETSGTFGGYMEGAVASAKRAAQFIHKT